MEIEVLQSDKQILKIAISGKLDANDVAQHAWELLTLVNNAKTPVILDFSEVTFLSSMGIRMLFSAYNDLKNRELALNLQNVRPEVQNVLKISGFDQIF